ncbi:MAG: acetyl-CoA carboxylase biotin carboxyl carrier protein [Chthoniobacterales bacterium]
MELKEIRALIDLMKKNGLAVFKMEKEGFKITLQTNAEFHPASYSPAPQPTPAAPAAGATPKGDAAPPAAPASDLKEITSPMVGTYYASPSPDSAPYVQVGSTVTPDTVVCIVEAMKVMNEIKAECAGTIEEIAADNGKPVQYGQALFRVK